MVLVLFLLGGVALLVLPHLTWGGAAVALGLVLVVRPLAGWLALAGLGWDPRDRLAAAFYGIRGIGSLYYLAYGLGSAGFARSRAALGDRGGGDPPVLHGAQPDRTLRHAPPVGGGDAMVEHASAQIEPTR